MVTSRRRALMAAVSQKSSDNPWGDLPPESTEFGFPLYLNLTEYDAMSDEWYRTEDSINTDLYEWCEQNFVEQDFVDSSASGYVPLTADTKIYINGGLVEEIYKDSGNYWMTGSKLPFEEVYVDVGGYMAGYGAKLPSSGDGSFGEEIQFHLNLMPIDDLYTLRAREGMTWADWVNTDYNTIGIVISYDYEGGRYVDYIGFAIISSDLGLPVHPQDEIMSEYTYEI